MGELDLREKICAVLPERVRSSCRIREVVREGNAAEQILRTAESLPAELLVLGPEHKPVAHATTIGVTTVRVTRHAPCPVLTL